MLGLLLLVTLAREANGKYVSGHLITHENWAFVARFCFLSEEGLFEYSIEYDEEYFGTLNLLLYYDSDTQWPAVYKTNKTCWEKESVLKIQQNQIVNLTAQHFGNGCVRHRQVGSKGSIKNLGTISCNNAKRFRSSRERWWFMAFSNCNSTVGLNVRYKFLMTNGPPGEYWHEHLSADEFYVLPILMTFTLIYMLMILAIVMCSVELKARQFLHATYKLFIVSVGLQELGIMSQCIAYIRYALDGVGHPKVKHFGQMCEAVSEICFLLLLLLLAKGYTVTRGRLRLGSSVKLTIFMCLYVVCFFCLFAYEREFFDPGEVIYLYDSAPGYGVISLRIIAWWMFIYSTVFTLKHYPEKVTFYYPFNIIGTLWFVAGPGMVLAANSQIDKWVRESVVCGAFHMIAFGGHLLFLFSDKFSNHNVTELISVHLGHPVATLSARRVIGHGVLVGLMRKLDIKAYQDFCILQILTLPSKANKNFPYHVRTNQIGMMEITGISGNSSIYQFGHHPYAPGGPMGVREVPFELFTVSRHLDIREKAIDFESHPFPHQIPPKYTQTILLPITIKSVSNEASPASSGFSTPKIEEGEQNVEIVEERSKSDSTGSDDKIVADDRKIHSADCPRGEHPSAPSDATTLHQNSRPSTASTVTLNATLQARETELSLEKLTDMFVAQSQKKN